MQTKILKVAALSLLFISLFSGCNENPKPNLASYNKDNIRKLRGAYQMYVFDHQLRGPKNEDSFKEYLTTNPNAIAKMERMGVTKENILSIFSSERDGKPFRVHYGINGLSDNAIISEEEGIDGIRMVAFSPPRELDAAEYEEVWAAAKNATKSKGPIEAGIPHFNNHMPLGIIYYPEYE